MKMVTKLHLQGYIYNHRCKHLTSAEQLGIHLMSNLFWENFPSQWEEFIENGWDNEWGDCPSEPDDDKQYIGSNAGIWLKKISTQHKHK